MNQSTRLGPVLGAATAAVAALALCAGPAHATGQPGTITSASPEAAGKCLDVYDWGNGPWIQMWDCHGGSNQSWQVVRNDVTGAWNLRTGAGGQYCADGSLGHGEQLIQNYCSNGLGQDWKLDSAAGATRLESVAFPGQCADIYNWGRSSVVMLWDCGTQANQYWILN
ncbi:RICIN domain-containing protein [Kitasatospora sp. NPDC096147]|uniref:RICIN domain-containing protein n=1 Tax=Kitasatospora sp. NPDC096147 TaxID=3364093 RepID=UPI00380EA08D